MNQKKKKTPVDRSLAGTAAAVHRGELDPVAHLEAFLSEIERQSSLNSYITICADLGRARADELARKTAGGEPAGMLAGAVIAIKDNLNLQGHPTTCASRILQSYISPYTATVVKKLLDAGAIIIGKTNLDEFAMGSSTENSVFGPARNPHDRERVPGGSSGGSAVAVAAGLAQAALGSDTGGSIRQPAAFTGITGIKPTYGRVSRYGLVAFASSFDQIGPFAQSVEDAALILQVISGYDQNDTTSAPVAVPDYLKGIHKDAAPLRVGIPRQFLTEGLNEEIAGRLDRIVAFLENTGHHVRDIDLPHAQYGIATYYILATAEASSNLARYDGLKYGYRSPEARDLIDSYCNTRSEGFGDEVKRRIMLGTYVLSSGYYDAYYRKAQQVRQLIRRDLQAVYENVDCILMPVTPTTAFKLGEKLDDPLEMYLSDIYTVLSNLAGNCSMSVPVGTDHHNLPIGLQIMADAFQEENMLRLAYLIEQSDV